MFADESAQLQAGCSGANRGKERDHGNSLRQWRKGVSVGVPPDEAMRDSGLPTGRDGRRTRESFDPNHPGCQCLATLRGSVPHARPVSAFLQTPEQAERSGSSLSRSVLVVPRRDGCQLKKPRRRAGRTAGPPWLVSPAHHEPVRILSSLIIQVPESRYNRSPSTTPFLALGGGRLWPVDRPQDQPANRSPSGP